MSRWVGWLSLLRTTPVLTLLACAALCAAWAPPASAKLPVRAQVVSKYPKPFALQYTKRVVVEVSKGSGSSPIHGWRAELYTFSGDLLGRSKRKRTLSGTQRARMKLKFPMQPGRYTLVVKGTPAGASSEEEYIKLVRFSDCLTALPIEYPAPPGGKASDYQDFLSVELESVDGNVVRNLHSQLYSFAGDFYGEGTLPVLFGKATLHNQLVRPLIPGGFTLIVEGTIDQPPSCGPKTSQLTLGFE